MLEIRTTVGTIEEASCIAKAFNELTIPLRVDVSIQEDLELIGFESDITKTIRFQRAFVNLNQREEQAHESIHEFFNLKRTEMMEEFEL